MWFFGLWELLVFVLNCVFLLVSSRDISIYLPLETPSSFGFIIKPGEMGFTGHSQIFVRLGVEEATLERVELWHRQ
jgi:hypothetical protein